MLSLISELGNELCKSWHTRSCWTDVNKQHLCTFRLELIMSFDYVAINMPVLVSAQSNQLG